MCAEEFIKCGLSNSSTMSFQQGLARSEEEEEEIVVAVVRPDMLQLQEGDEAAAGGE